MVPFNKNHFKQEFRNWVEQNPLASLESARDFCLQMAPEGYLRAHPWLLEQSLQWFEWLQQQRLCRNDPNELDEIQHISI